MSASTAIGMVSESLRDLLEDEMQIIPSVNVTVLGPDENGPARRINLFLYKVEENAYLKNKDWEVSRTNANQITPPPLSINLFYLLTAYAQNDQQNGNATAHAILGEAMRVLNENAIIPAVNLVPGLGDARESIKVILNNVDLDELSKVWSTFNEPFRLSVPYEVSVVQLDQQPTNTQDIPTRVTTLGIPNVESPYRVPSVSGLTPISGTAGTVITFEGENLNGWSAYVTMNGVRILDGQTISGDSFSATVPAGFPGGFHQIRVDISRLYRNTFFFELTP